MKLSGLIELTFLLILTSCAEGIGNWTVNVNDHIEVGRGSSVTIDCTFKCPSTQCDGKVEVYWKKFQMSSFNTKDNDKYAFIYHKNDTYVLEKYRGRTELKNEGSGDCSLEIKNVTENDSELYVRIITPSEQYSFYNNKVAIRVVAPAENNSLQMYTTICVPVAALVILIIIVGVFCFIKHKRTQAFTREESGYYENFSRALSNDAKSEISCKKIDELPELKDIEEPVYVNMKDPLDRVDQSVDHTHNVYGNVDYSQ
ncbi:uncharacterized protein LOC132984136 isoform X2 [Labrus mixtus]|uniref:uncharacterized protein LOC132984136 isoform X2 n=1 Tax=Labrus mixtus TaxID=508554 RepID=UPI0029C05876|nr:uncharacterized protein LOC132984136 isoform X2 [Labrus mixtus]